MFGMALILLAVGLIAAPIVGLATGSKSNALGAAGGAVLVAVIFTLLASVAIVGTKEVGIELSWNRPVGTLDNGFHLIAPWETVQEMDGAIQTDNHDQGAGNCINVRIAHQIIACADVTIRWRIHEQDAGSLFQNYRDFENVRNSLVTRELATDLNSVAQDYDPLAVDANGNSTATPLNTIAQQVQQQIANQIGGQVDVLSVFIPVLHFDAATQGRINALQAQIAQTRIAEQSVKTAAQQAQANAQLSQTVSNDPNVLVAKCFDLLSEMVNKGAAIPTGFSCWPGGGTGVVIPAANK